MSKVVVSKEVIEAIEHLRTKSKYSFERFMSTAINSKHGFHNKALREVSLEDLAQILLGNYELEPEPSKVIGDLYNFHQTKAYSYNGKTGGDYHHGVTQGIKAVLRAYKLEAEGVEV